MKRIVVGVTGASGIPYARSLVRSLSGHPEVERLHLVISGYGYQAVREELKLTGGENECIEAITGGSSGKIVPHPPTDMTAPREKTRAGAPITSPIWAGACFRRRQPAWQNSSNIPAA